MGQIGREATHLVKVAVEAAVGKGPHVAFYGTDYVTADGTCVRDYIHEWLIEHDSENLVMNCGYAHGSSVLEVLDAVDRLTNHPIKRVMEHRRPGDVSELVACNRKTLEALDWRPQYADLDRVVRDALAWERKTGWPGPGDSRRLVLGGWEIPQTSSLLWPGSSAISAPCMARTAQRAVYQRCPDGRLRPVVIVSANGAWFIVNFCAGLIRSLQRAGYEPIVFAPTEPALEPRIRELGVRHFDVRLERSGVNPLADLRLLASYRRLMKTVRPVAYLSYTIKPNIYGSLAASSLGIPAIPNVSGLGTAFMRSGALQWIVTRLYRIAFRRVPIVHFQNRDDRELFLGRRIIDLERTRLVPGSGIDLKRFKSTPVRDGPPVFLFIGRLLGDKGVVEYVRAARLLRNELPDARFQLLGPLDVDNRTAIREPKLQGWVSKGLIEYLGATDDVRPFIRAASAVVLPSYREGLPRSLVEAAAMGRPLIATDVPGCREVVEDGVNGFLCKPADTESLAGAMRKFAELPQKSRNAMGGASRRKAQDRFSDQIVVRTYLEGLKRLVSSQR